MDGCCEPNWRDCVNIISPGTHFRHFKTKKEIREMLEKYREELQREIEGINERIKELSEKES